MSDPLVFTVAKADPTGKDETPGVVLHITADLRSVRETLPRAIWRAANLNIHVEDAQQVCAALAHLPQGTIDQVLVLLLQQRASLLRVRVAPSPTLGEFIGREAATMPQPLPENGYSAPYIEGWNAALSQLTRRLEEGREGKESLPSTRCGRPMLRPDAAARTRMAQLGQEVSLPAWHCGRQDCASCNASGFQEVPT